MPHVLHLADGATWGRTGSHSTAVEPPADRSAPLENRRDWRAYGAHGRVGYVVVGAAMLAAAALPGTATASTGGCRTSTCEERVARKQCSQTKPVACIRRASLTHRVSFGLLLRKARCESTLNPYAANASGATGLMQFMPSTWATTPYRSRWILSAKWNALAGAWMHRPDVQRGGEWSCR